MPTAGEIMAKDVLGVAPETSLVDAARRMNERHVGAVIVLDGERLVGLLTERDVLRAVATGDVERPVSQAMTTAPETIETDESSGHAAALMIHGGFRHLPVMDGGKLVGLVSIGDLVTDIISEQRFIIEQLEHYLTGVRG